MNRLKREVASRLGINPRVVSVIVGTTAAVGRLLEQADKEPDNRSVMAGWDKENDRRFFERRARSAGLHRAGLRDLIAQLEESRG